MNILRLLGFNIDIDNAFTLLLAVVRGVWVGLMGFNGLLWALAINDFKFWKYVKFHNLCLKFKEPLSF